MDSKTVLIEGLKVHYYERIINQSFDSIVCLHGLGGVGLNFIELSKLIEGYNFIALDLPGHGQSDQLKNFSIASLIDWLNAFINQIQLKEFSILAHSYGGDLGIHYADSYSNKVKKMILLDGGYYNKPLQYRLIKEQYDKGAWPLNPIDSLEKECQYYKEDFDTFIFKSKEEYLKSEKESFKRVSEDIEEALLAVMKEEDNVLKFIASGETAVKAIKAMYEDPSAEKISGLSIPTLLMVGTEPEYYLSLRRNLIQNLGNPKAVKVVELEETSHFLLWDKPKEVSMIIQNFLKE